MINEYDEYNKGLTKGAGDIAGNKILTLVAAFDSMIAIGHSAGYDLTVELMIHSRENLELNSCYKPRYKNVLKETYEYKKNMLINYNNRTFGEGEFSKKDSYIEIDAFASIHKYRYNKTEDKSGIVIADRYDFEDLNYDNILISIGNNVMSELQKAKMIIPYYVIIELSEKYDNRTINKGNIEFWNTKTYFEKTGIIGRGETLEYIFSVNANVNKTIQTYGPDDTILELYETNGSFVAYDDNSGYADNACICPYLTTDKEYRLLIHLKSKDDVANVRIGFCSSVSPYFDQIENIEENGFWSKTFETKEIIAYLNISNMYKIRKSENKDITMQTTKKGNEFCDTYLFLIDPRRSDFYGTGSSEDNPPLYIYDDDGGYHGQSKLNIPNYFFPHSIDFIVLSTLYNLSFTGEYYLETSYN